jgi:hypothetical protein
MASLADDVPRATTVTTSIGELPRTELSRGLVYVTGITCGVLAAIAAEILMRSTGVEIADTWRSIASTQGLEIRSVSAFWLMAGSSFVVSAVVAAALSRLPLPWHRLRALRWLAGAVLVFALAEVGHIAAITDGHGGGTHAAMSLAALGTAALVALFAAYFATRT